jgi:hypothetical protein
VDHNGEGLDVKGEAIVHGARRRDCVGGTG